MEKKFRVFVYLNLIFWEKYLLLIIKSLTSLSVKVMLLFNSGSFFIALQIINLLSTPLTTDACGA